MVKRGAEDEELTGPSCVWGAPSLLRMGSSSLRQLMTTSASTLLQVSIVDRRLLTNKRGASQPSEDPERFCARQSRHGFYPGAQGVIADRR